MHKLSERKERHSLLSTPENLSPVTIFGKTQKPESSVLKSLYHVSLNDPKDLLFKTVRFSNDIIIIADRKRTILYANPAVCRKTGYRLKELLGQKLPILYRKEDRAGYAGRILKHIRESGRWRGEVEIRRKNGTTFSTSTVMSAFYDETGSPAGTVGIGRDLTHEKLLLRHALEKEHRLQCIIESMEDAICVCDKEGKILMVNSAHCRMLGYRKEEIVGAKSPYPWIDSADVARSKLLMKRVQKEGSVKNVSLAWRRRDNRRLLVSVAMSQYVTPSRGTDGQVCTIRDITDVQYSEDLRHANEQIQRLIFDIKRKAARLQTLDETNTLMLHQAKISSIFQEITKGVKRLVVHDLAGIYVYDALKKSLVPHTLSKQTAFSRELAKFSLRIGQGIIGEAALTGHLVLANDAHLDPRSRYPKGMKPDCEHFIAVPLKAKNSIFGILVVARHREPGFIEEEAEVIKSFANAASVALENARMISKLTQRRTKGPGAGFTDISNWLGSEHQVQRISREGKSSRK